jgi:UDP-glucose 4-epimerase
MKILITGGAGFIGSNLLKFLINESEVEEIRIYDDLSTCGTAYLEEIAGVRFADEYYGHKVKVVREGAPLVLRLYASSVLDVEALTHAVEGVDGIVHLAAFTEVVKSVEEPAHALKINLEGTTNVLESARLAGVQRVVFASSNAAVGEAQQPINEDRLPRPLSPYGAAKLCGEALCSAYATCYDMTVTALRFANAYGPYSQHKRSVIAKMLKERLSGSDLMICGDGTQTRDFIAAHDIARAIWLALGREGGFELFQVATGKETSINELVALINRLDGTKQNVVHSDARLGEIVRNYSSIDKIQRELQFRPTVTLQQGLADLYSHFCNRVNAG